jgi:nicotinamidase-related amidase
MTCIVQVDSYSGFFDNCQGYETRLQADLRSCGVSEVYVCMHACMGVCVCVCVCVCMCVCNM